MEKPFNFIVPTEFCIKYAMEEKIIVNILLGNSTIRIHCRRLHWLVNNYSNKSQRAVAVINSSYKQQMY